MFNFRVFAYTLVLSSIFAGFSTDASPATIDNESRPEKKEQRTSTLLVSNNTDSLQLQQKVNIKLEAIKPRMLGESKIRLPDPSIQSYNAHLRRLKLLPSRGQSIEIRVQDNNVQRLLKQQLNDAIEIYQIVGQLLDSGKLNDIASPTLPALPAIAIAIAETNLATTPSEQLAANEVCLTISQEWERDSQALEQAGLGLRSNVLNASYYRQYCEIQRIKLAEKSLNSSAVREASLQQNSIKLSEIKPIEIPPHPSIEELPIEKRERARQYRREVAQLINPLISYYNANIRLLNLIPRRQTLEILKEDSALQKLQKQQLSVALELNRLQGLRLAAGLITNSNEGFYELIDNPITEIVLPAIGIALADMNLATNLKEQAVANEVGLKIAQAWEKNAVLAEKNALRKRIVVLTARYWRRHFKVQKLRAESNKRS